MPLLLLPLPLAVTVGLLGRRFAVGYWRVLRWRCCHQKPLSPPDFAMNTTTVIAMNDVNNDALAPTNSGFLLCVSPATTSMHRRAKRWRLAVMLWQNPDFIPSLLRIYSYVSLAPSHRFRLSHLSVG